MFSCTMILAAALATTAAVAPPPPPPPAPARAPLSGELFTIEYSVREAGSTAAPLAAAEVTLGADRPSVFQHRQPKGSDIEVFLEVRPRDDGTVAVELRWDESGASGERVRWSPVVVVKRGVEATARVGWAGGGRLLSLLVR